MNVGPIYIYALTGVESVDMRPPIGLLYTGDA